MVNILEKNSNCEIFYNKLLKDLLTILSTDYKLFCLNFCIQALYIHNIYKICSLKRVTANLNYKDRTKLSALVKACFNPPASLPPAVAK